MKQVPIILAVLAASPTFACKNKPVAKAAEQVESLMVLRQANQVLKRDNGPVDPVVEKSDKRYLLPPAERANEKLKSGIN